MLAGMIVQEAGSNIRGRLVILVGLLIHWAVHEWLDQHGPNIGRQIMEALRLLVADDHEIVRKGLRSLLEAQPGWHVAGEASDGREAVEKAKELHPDVTVLDIGMPSLNGLEATRQMLKNDSRAKILILTMHESDPLIRDVL